MIKKVAIVFGVVFVLIGILGFVPGITTSDGLLLGIFNVNAVHNIVHLLSGIVALAAASSEKNSKMYFQIFGVVYALVAVLGFYYQGNEILGLVASNMYDTYLHVLIALVALYFGFASKEVATV